MLFDEMNEVLMLKFPELKSLYEEQFSFWGDEIPPQHCFYGAVLNNYVSMLLLKHQDQQMIKRIFEFYEELANSNDMEVKNLLQVTLLEYLWDDPIIYNNAIKHMLTETKNINDQIGEYLRKP